ncbi:MAG: hypothetical protein NVS3B21_03430 [Acidimicrobiales bacterium]
MTVYVLCPDARSAAGGVKKLYNHVDILNSAGLAAAIVHGRSNFRVSWFDNATKIVNPPIDLGPGDLLAIPEVYGDHLVTLAPGIPRVSVNQNAYSSFDRVKNVAQHPYLTCPDLISVTAVSQNNLEYLQFLFPQLLIRRIRYGFDPGMFSHSGEPPDRIIAYMPRKRPAIADEVLRLLRNSEVMGSWTIAPIEGMSETQVAVMLRKTALFLSFSEREGCPMPPVEALATGCFVIGFDGYGGREYFDPRFTNRIEDGDVLAFAKAIKSWLSRFTWDEGESARAAAGSSFVLRRYSQQAERADVLDFYGSALAEADRSPSRTVLRSIPDLLAGPWGPLQPLKSQLTRRWR